MRSEGSSSPISLARHRSRRLRAWRGRRRVMPGDRGASPPPVGEQGTPHRAPSRPPADRGHRIGVVANGNGRSQPSRHGAPARRQHRSAEGWPTTPPGTRTQRPIGVKARGSGPCRPPRSGCFRRCRPRRRQQTPTLRTSRHPSRAARSIASDHRTHGRRADRRVGERTGTGCGAGDGRSGANARAQRGQCLRRAIRCQPTRIAGGVVGSRQCSAAAVGSRPAAQDRAGLDADVGGRSRTSCGNCGRRPRSSESRRRPRAVGVEDAEPW